MPTTTARLALTQPVGGDPPSVYRTSISGNAVILDRAATAYSGTLAARPAPATVPVDSLYRCTDVAAAFYNDGVKWHFLATDGNTSPVGAMMAYAGTSDPIDTDGVTRWMISDGRLLASANYPALFAVTGSIFGGNSTNFALPDTRGRTIMSPDAGFAQGAAGRLHAQTVSGIVNGNARGSSGGVDAQPISLLEMPAHNHPTSTLSTDRATPAGWNTPITQDGIVWSLGGSNSGEVVPRNGGSQDWTASVLNHTHTLTVSLQGGGTPRINTPPYVVAHHIVKVL